MIKVKMMILWLFIAKHVAAQGKKDNLNTFFTTLSQNGQFNGNVLIAENGNILSEKSFGYADLSAKRLNTVQTSFPIAAITKTVTSTAILQKKKKGKLQLEDSVSKFLRDYPYRKPIKDKNVDILGDEALKRFSIFLIFKKMWSI